MSPFESDLLKVLASIDKSLRQLSGRELDDGEEQGPLAQSSHAPAAPSSPDDLKL